MKAESDFPLGSLINAALRQFGAGIAIAAVFAVAVIRIYSDLERRTDALVLMIEKQARNDQELADVLRTLTEEIRRK